MKSGSLLRILACVIAAAALSACENPNPIGSTVKGTRVAVMQNTKTIEADKDVTGEKPELFDAVNNSTWPQAGYEPSHILPNAGIGEHLQEAWRSSVGEGSDSDFKLLARPVISNGRVFTMDAQGVVKAFDTKSGGHLWTYDTTPEKADENEIGGGLAVDGDNLYATTGFGEIIDLNSGTGTVRWRHSLTNPLRAAPTVADGRVYVVSIDNELQALNMNTGEVLWHHNGIAESATLMGASNPAVAGDGVVVAYSSGEIYNLRAENGRVSWNYMLTMPTQVGALPAIADIRGLPVIDRDRVIAVSHSGRMAAIDYRSGDRAWEADIGGINTPVVSGSGVFVLTNDGQLTALQRESGRILWVQELQHLEDPEDHDSDPVFWTGPVLGGSRLWLVNSLGQLVSFSPNDGGTLETYDLGHAAYVSPVIAGNTMYVVTDDGYLVALR